MEDLWEHHGGKLVALAGLIVGGLFVWAGFPTLYAFFSRF